ncbi:hypothetical protein [Burkholderia vietnamiensis]|uniref:hypothetical protein n=1 Tax=Burkholderia vietnamiensis TaxID=60552 RepID=UPI0007533862|nr:hypothetical protein [Burkholderia vietnamiensis]KVF40988.1 hypothetical protein WJ09_24540 [Burkholderia vietnamiensis]
MESTLNSLDLSGATMNVFCPTVREGLSQNVGLSSDHLMDVIETGAMAWLAALLAQCTVAQRASVVHEVVISPQANARIGEQLRMAVSDMAYLKDLEANGDALAQRAIGKRIAVLCESISAQSGVPKQAVHFLTGLSVSVMFGLLKYNLLLEQAGFDALEPWLRQQWPRIVPRLTDEVVRAIGWESVASLAMSIEQAPRDPQHTPTVAMNPSTAIPATTTTLWRTIMADVVVAGSASRTPAQNAPESSRNAPAQTASVDPDRQAKPRPRGASKWLWAIAAFVIALAAVLAYDDAHTGIVRRSMSKWIEEISAHMRVSPTGPAQSEARGASGTSATGPIVDASQERARP